MPRYCCVPQCKSHSLKEKCMFHKFPKNKKLYKQWCIAIKTGKNPSSNAVVCSKHFKDCDYFESLSGLRKVLINGSCPSENLPIRSLERHVPKPRLRNLNKYRESDLEINQSAQTDQNFANSTVTENVIVEKKIINKGTQTLWQRLTIHSAMLFCNLNGDEVKYFTGFEINQFNLIFAAIGIYSTPYDTYVDSKNQLAITLIKYRRGIDFILIAKLYNLQRQTTSEIFKFWTKAIYKYLRKINFWELRYKDINSYTAIIDCTEIYTERCTWDPNVNQELFSNYKNHNTLKYLIAIDEKCLLIFCSDVYGGSKSDRFIIQNSQFLDLLESGNIILADRGFNVSDLLEEKNIALNLPPFKTASQFRPEEVIETRVLANRRIHVERVINLTKKNKILSSSIPASLWPQVNEIVYNANMLCNFKDRII